jgi:hypothetical protein
MKKEEKTDADVKEESKTSDHDGHEEHDGHGHDGHGHDEHGHDGHVEGQSSGNRFLVSAILTLSVSCILGLIV